MVYKRKAHVLFVGSGDSSRARMAASFANSLGAQYMQARALGVAAEPLLPELQHALRALGVEGLEQALPPLDADHLQWADVLIALDVGVAQACPQLPQGVQTRCYAFATPANTQHLHQIREAIRQRIAGMLGGMKMLA